MLKLKGDTLRRIQKYFKWIIFSFLMSLVIVFGSLSVTSMADTNPVTESEDEWIGGEDHLSDEEKPAYIQEIEAKRKISDSFEIVALRESNVKHYAMPDGTYQAVVYAYDVHEMDAEGQWVDKFVTSASGSNQYMDITKSHPVKQAGLCQSNPEKRMNLTATRY